MRPDPPFYIGATRPSAIGWTRLGITLGVGAVLAVLMAQRSTPAATALVVILFGGLAIWTWATQWTRFIVDEHGLTVSLGGILPRRPWPLADFRTVQLRTLPPASAGATIGGYGWRRGSVISARPEELTAVGTRRIFTTAAAKQPCRIMVTGPGTIVEIIGRGTTDYLISPVDAQATAEAVDQAIRSRR